MTDRDEKLARLYRALAKEEPPQALDAAVLAASRRALARPSLARRWAVPVSLAAVLVLAIGLTLEMRDQAPGIEAPTASPPPMREDRAAPSAPEATRAAPELQRAPEVKPPAAEPRRAAPQAKRATREMKPAVPEAKPAAPEAERREFVPVPKREETTLAPPRPQLRAAPAPALQAPPAASNVAPAQSAARSAADAGARAAPAAADPIASLEAIAKLRAAGRDDEADRALEEFRRRFPGYTIDAAMWERVKPR